MLVLGGGQSGVQIAEDLLEAGRRVFLATSPAGRVPRRCRGRDSFARLVDEGFFDTPREQATRARSRRSGTISGVAADASHIADLVLQCLAAPRLAA